VWMNDRWWFLLVSLGIVAVLSAAVWGATFCPSGHSHETVDAVLADAATGVVASNPHSVEAYLRLAAVEADRCRYAQAVEALTQAIELDPERPETYFSRALTYREIGMSSEAIKDCNRVLELHPDHAPALKLRAKFFAGKEDRAAALADLSRCIALAPQDPSAFVERAKVYGEDGDRALAVNDLSRAIELDRASATAYYLRGREYVELEDYEAALSDFLAASALKPNQCWYHVSMAEVYTATGRHSDAVDEWAEFLDLGANTAYGHTRRAYALCRADRCEEAALELERVFGRTPDHPPALLLRAWLAAQREEVEQARADLTVLATSCAEKPYGAVAREAMELLDAQKADEWELPEER